MEKTSSQVKDDREIQQGQTSSLNSSQENALHVEVLIESGNISFKNGDLDQAMTYFEIALDKQIHETGENSLPICRILNNIGIVYRRLGRSDDALTAYRRSVDIKTSHFGLNSVELISTLHNMGSLHYSMGNYDNALLYCLSAHRIVRLHHMDNPHENSLQEAYILNSLGWIDVMQNGGQNATPIFSKVLEILESEGIPDEDQRIISAHEGIRQVKTNRP